MANRSERAVDALRETADQAAQLGGQAGGAEAGHATTLDRGPGRQEPVPAAADKSTRRLPRVDTAPSTADPVARPISVEAYNPLFDALVRADDDLTGLLAYALYKQNKRDWLITFHKTHGRVPTADETAAFIMGESIERRLVTYRRLAEDLLARHAENRASRSGDIGRPSSSMAADPDAMPADMAPANPAIAAPSSISAARPLVAVGQPQRRTGWLVYGVSLALVVVGLYLLGRFAFGWR
jgi:hypothetical protein